MTDPVKAQYEALPYPPRDPKDETKRLIVGSPSRTAELAHFVFGGKRDFTRPFRALVAGGGTGDAAIMLGQQMADLGDAAEIVYLDWSSASRKVAQARAQARGLTNMKFVSASLIDYATLGLGRFDYIDCCGVLHHLPDPPATLAALTDSLTPDGGIGMMLYGRLGRTGIYQAQDMMRAVIAAGDDIPAQVALARKLLAQLPDSNWLKRNTLITDHLTAGDSGVYDLLLHARDRAYDIGEIGALLGGAGLRLAGFIPPARYEPASYLSDATLLRRVASLPPLARAAFAENLSGTMITHIFYAVRAANPVAPPLPDDPAAIPVYCEPGVAEAALKAKPGGMLTGGVPGWSVKLPLPPLAPAIAAQIDGARNLRDIHGELRKLRSDLSWDDFAAQFAIYYAAFHGVGYLMLKLPA